MGLTQSGTSLDVLLRSLDAFADGDVQHDVATALAVEGQRLVRRGFSESRAPDGSRWKALASRRGRTQTRRPLVNRGQFAAAAARYTVDRDGFVFESALDVAKYHQSEEPRTSTLPRRPFYPDEGGLSVWWEIQLRDGADGALREHLPR
ncbi:MAG: hypothetical protein JWM10_3707 [Myxococcaceae bacterium]|nr:hypothetical protein [Myxococcaceae bacterium]